MSDSFDLARFVAAQDPVIAQVERELRGRQKRTHWMWFIFPQIRGLGHSPTARHYAIQSLAEAKAYLMHPILGVRLRACTTLVNQVEGRTAHAIFGSPDDMKFHSSMTLFSLADPEEANFRLALERYFSGAMDQRTVNTVA